MLKKKLEKYLNENDNILIALNSIAINVKNASSENIFLDYMTRYLTESESKTLFSKLVKDSLLIKSIQYECDDEFHPTTLLQETCEYCDEKIEEHEYYILYKVNFFDLLRTFNRELISEYFSESSYIVMCDIRDNMHKVIPFVGAGISKSLGFPLWKELFLVAREGFAKEFISLFDKRYEEGNIEKLIDCIIEFHPLINDEKDLKSKIIKPQVTKKLTYEDFFNSVIPNLLDLNVEYIITTNYDKSLEQCNQFMGYEYDVSRNLMNFEGFDNLSDQKYIFHIHGDIDSLDSMIVTKKDYDDLYSLEKNKRILTGLISKQSLLFLGFSLSDQYFSQELKKISDSNKGYGTNYMVLINASLYDEKNILDSNNVKFISVNATKNDNDDYEVEKQYKFLFEFLKGNIYD